MKGAIECRSLGGCCCAASVSVSVSDLVLNSPSC